MAVDFKKTWVEKNKTPEDEACRGLVCRQGVAALSTQVDRAQGASVALFGVLFMMVVIVSPLR